MITWSGELFPEGLIMSIKRIICAGHVCLDITPAIPGQGARGKIGEILAPGKLLQVGRASLSVGGAVSSTGLGLKVLGAEVSLMGKIGNDAFGGQILKEFGRYGAQEGLIVQEEDATSYTVAIAVPGIDRIFLHDPGVNDTFVSEDIPDRALDGAELFHFGYPSVMRSMYEEDGAELVKLFRRVKAHGIATSLDFCAIDPTSPAGHADWTAILQRLLPYVDFFVPSFEELCFMLDRERYDRL